MLLHLHIYRRSENLHGHTELELSNLLFSGQPCAKKQENDAVFNKSMLHQIPGCAASLNALEDDQ